MGALDLPEIPASLVRAHCAGAVRMGLDIGHLLRDAAIDVDVADQASKISSAQHMCLMLGNIVALGDEMHGLTVNPVKTGIAELSVRAMLSATSLVDAVDIYARFYRVAANALRVETDVSEAGLEIRLLADSATPAEGAALEEIYSLWIVMILSWLARRRLRVDRFTVRDPSHANIGGRHWGHGGPTRFGACTSLLLADWKQSIPRTAKTPDSLQWAVNQSWLSISPPLAPTAQWAHAGLRAADVARPEKVSVRTLRRRLAVQGSGFRDQRIQAVVQDAVRWLRATDAKIDDIAERMGYADARSFRRLLKNATGMSPSELRTHGLNAPARPQPMLLRQIEAFSRDVAG